MKKLIYTGPRNDDFGLLLANGERVVVYPGKSLTLSNENADHVLRRWPDLFEVEAEIEAEAEPLGEVDEKPSSSRKRSRSSVIKTIAPGAETTGEE